MKNKLVKNTKQAQIKCSHIAANMQPGHFCAANGCKSGLQNDYLSPGRQIFCIGSITKSIL
jgi:hypothetical protein